MFKNIIKTTAFAATLFMMACGGNSTQEQEQVVNLYSHRHYEADQKLFEEFTKETGIKVNVVNASADELIQKLELEGENSPADVLFTVDAGRLHRAEVKGLLQPITSDVLNENIPANLRHPEGLWFGLTYRARVIAYSKERVDPADLSTYEDLANERWKGKVLVRSSENVYNQSLLASIIAADGAEAATAWAEGMVANMARAPKGGDRDQVKAVAGGEGDIAITNTYYVGIMLNDSNEEERKAAEAVGIFFPNQNDRGTHINISGVGVAKYAPNKENAIKLIEFLSQEKAQKVLAEENYEYPVNAKVSISETIAAWGDFKKDSINLAKLGELNSEAVVTFDKAGWK
ncbi:Fe(3+) ABC transporter substrate-binding protein [Penaeicola halotolerans]|uniref:Fe(3+) ABC transporter substrate-binding protein n=1 Tax=Penaeicola halotolerans TaxID=2793196 RepID=UPI001CF9036A|nr:Fe(3+) ABC transporter substrate-binding protein [Penaeicola halotolerans]